MLKSSVCLPAQSPLASARTNVAPLPRFRSQKCSTKNQIVSRASSEAASPAESKPQQFVVVGPGTPEPDYKAVDASTVSKIIQGLFRRKMVQAIGQDVEEQGYDGIISLTRVLNTKFATVRETQVATIGILVSLFPSWLLPFFRATFARYMPEFSCKMNAVATALSCEWLMGKCTVNDVEVDGGKLGKNQGVLVERCRYLEQAGCASVCINSCKIPTQEFFEKHMDLPVTLTPNYTDYSCQFAFGKTPDPQDADPVFKTPCFTQCPSKRKPAGGQPSGQTQCPGVVAGTQ